MKQDQACHVPVTERSKIKYRESRERKVKEAGRNQIRLARTLHFIVSVNRTSPMVSKMN